VGKQEGMILVLGDAMLDRHWYGRTERISPEAPVPVVDFDKEIWSLGAAANVAAHITTAGIGCMFAYKESCPGDLVKDTTDWTRFVNMCCEKGILLRPMCTEKACPVTLKTRVWSNGQQIVRIDNENRDKFEVNEGWKTYILSLFRDYDIKIVIFSDYDKGTLSDWLINEISAYCYVQDIPTLLDPKRPTFHKLRNLSIVKPNRREVSATNLTAAECSAELRDTWLVHTLGSEGMAVYKQGSLEWSCPTVAREVVEVCGCGDTVTALLALSIYRGLNIKQAVLAANKGASFTIRHEGCYIPDRDEIKECFQYE